MNKRAIFVFILLLAAMVSAELTIHIYNPWFENPYRQDSVFITGVQEVQYHPGTKMIPEGNGWFYFTLVESFFSNSSVTFKSYIGNQYNEHAARADFPDSSSSAIRLNGDLLDQFPGHEEFWIIPIDSTSRYDVHVQPPDGKVIYLMNPWPNNSPQILIGSNPAKKMWINNDICGWYTFFFSGMIDSLKNVFFTDYYHEYKYGSDGLRGETPMDLSPYFETEDTIYILPRPFPKGAPSITHKFPGRTGECPERKVSALVRDWKADDVSFFVSGKNGGTVTRNMVQSRLGENGKPIAGENAAKADGQELESWFITEDNNETCIDLVLTKGYDGLWEYDSDIFGGFFPIDSFDHPNNIQYEDSKGNMRNFHFTMEMHMQFEYRREANQEFIFRGDDDVWIFVNNQLAIDLGGFHPPAADTLILNELASDLGLEDGQNYPMDIFFAERQPTNSNFLVRTSLDLRNSTDLFYVDELLGPGKTEYDIMQIVGTQGLDCGFTPLVNEEEPAVVEFYIEGPHFEQQHGPLEHKTHWGGINVGPSSVTIDSAAIEDLKPGEYILTFASTFDQDRKGYLTFEVGGKLPPVISIDPPGREFVEPITVSISVNDPEAIIYYTLDGTIPSESSLRYEQPLVFESTTQLNARAFAPETDPSEVLSETYTRTINGREGSFYDRDGDGAIDSISIQLDHPALRPPDTLNMNEPFTGAKRVLVASQLSLSEDGMSVGANLQGAFSFMNNTGFDTGNYASFGGVGFGRAPIPINDMIAPVILQAKFTPKLFSEDQTEADLGTLSVIFSEEIEPVTGNQTFQFEQGGLPYSLELKLVSQSGQKVTYKVTNILVVAFAENGDLISISPEQNIVDVRGNVQDKENNRPAQLQVLPPKYDVSFITGPNPFTPGETQTHLADGEPATGITMIADFRGNLRSLAQKVSAEVTIYDCMNNLVCQTSQPGPSDSPVQFILEQAPRTRVIFLWTGHSESGRKVGAGTYLAVVTVTDPSGNPIVRKIPIGVTY